MPAAARSTDDPTKPAAKPAPPPGRGPGRQTGRPAGDLAAAVAAEARSRGVWLGVAESLTGGLVASRLAAAEGASRWFRGAIVAYATAVKHDLLAVPSGPVVSAPAAAAMAESASRLLGADVCLALTGAAGPDPQDGQPPGTVYVAVHAAGGTAVQRWQVPGASPAEICAAATERALALLAAAVAAQEAAG